MGQILLILLATFSVSMSSLVENWDKFVDPNGAFEVLMPDSVATVTTKYETALGEIEYVVSSSDAMYGAQKINYSVSYCDYPKGVFHKDSTELISLFFDETVNASVESMEGSLLYSDDHLGSKYPARIWKVVSDKLGIHVKSTALMVGNRYYCLQVITPSSLSVHSSGDEFFDSFKLNHK